MKKFEILRYLKRFSLLIFLVSLAGAAAIYLYADGRQMYTASVIIRYTNDGISDGYTLDGQLIATSATGQVEAPANGIFIAVSGAAKCKIVVK